MPLISSKLQVPVTTIAALEANSEPWLELRWKGESTSFFIPLTAIRPAGELKVSLTEMKLPSLSVVHSLLQPVAKKKDALYQAEVFISNAKYFWAASQSAISFSRESTSSSGMTLLS